MKVQLAFGRVSSFGPHIWQTVSCARREEEDHRGYEVHRDGCHGRQLGREVSESEYIRFGVNLDLRTTNPESQMEANVI